MTHLQTKSYGSPLPQKTRDCAITRSRYKMLEKQVEPDVYYSDEDDSRTLHQRTEFDDIIHQAQGQINRTPVKEEELGVLPKPKKNRGPLTPSKKKPAKGKQQPSSPPIIPHEQPTTLLAEPMPILAPDLSLVPIPEETQQEAEPTQRPYIDRQVSFETPEQTSFKRMEGEKMRVDRKFAAAMGTEARKMKKPDDCFHLMSEYRAYFEKETNLSYEEYIQGHQKAKEKAITSKICQIIKLQKDTKNQLLKRLQQQKYRFKKSASNVMNSIVEISHNCNHEVLDKSVVNAACASNLNESFCAINKFLASNHTLINEHLQEQSKDKIIQNTQIANNHQNSEADSKGITRDHQKRKDRPRNADNSQRTVFEQHSHEYQIMQTNKHLDMELNKTNDRKKILMSIQDVNRQCEEDEKHLRLESERLERERQEKERAKMSKKEQASSMSSNVEISKQQGFAEMDSERKRLESLKDIQMFNYSRNSQKIKRLEILNRYHYNPFEENEGEDQCQLWKKLMGMQIKNLKNDNPSIKSEDVNTQLIEQMLKEVAQNQSKEKLKNKNDIFHLDTTYKPPEQPPEKSKEQEAFREILERDEELREKKTKICKKEKKKNKSKKDKDSKSGIEIRDNKKSSNYEPEIEDFFTFEPIGKIEYQQVMEPDEPSPQPKLEYFGSNHYANELSPIQEYPQIETSNQHRQQQNSPKFTFDQLADFQDFEALKEEHREQDDQPLFGGAHNSYHDFEYYEGLANNQNN